MFGLVGQESPAYVTRQADADLVAGLRSGDFCYVLNSRQMGKSSLRVRAMQRLQAEGVACAAIGNNEFENLALACDPIEKL